jgi:predicted outer membrane repeat protein
VTQKSCNRLNCDIFHWLETLQKCKVEIVKIDKVYRHANALSSIFFCGGKILMNVFKARLLSVFVLGCLLAALPGSYVQALGSVIYVNQKAIIGFNNGTSWRDAYTNLQKALAAAPKGAEIWVAEGVYKPTTDFDRSASFQLKNEVELYGGFAGNETSRNQRNPHENVTILSGDTGQANNTNDNSYHVVMSGATTAATAVLDGFTVEYGNANGGSLASDLLGGGMYNRGDPTLKSIIFSNNYATNGGGGMYNLGNPMINNVLFYMNATLTNGGGMYNSSSSPTLNRVTFRNNFAEDGGGGMYNEHGSPTLRNVTFSNNSGNSSGGGMYNASSDPTLIDVIFSNNTADGLGGGMFNISSNPILTGGAFNSNSAFHGGGMANYSSSNPILTNVTFNGNTAGYYGGGLYCTSSSSTLTGVTFSGNTALEGGGGMYSCNSATLTNVTFSGNSAGSSGGGMVSSSNSTFTNVTFSGNSAGSSGGGISNIGNSTFTNVTFSGNSADRGGGMQNAGNPTLTNVTFSNNSAGSAGGGLRNDGRPILHNTILWGNTAPNGSQVFDNGGQAGCNPVSINDSAVQGGCPAGSICTDIITTDPLLGTLGDYGGSTQTIPLQAGSSAIDTGNDASCPATDQRGVARPQGSHCDLGAYEAVIVNVGAGTYDDTDPAWNYTGTWTTFNGSGPYNNTLHQSNTIGSSAEVTFVGTMISLMYLQAPGRGSIDVYIDGVKVDTLDADNPTIVWQPTWTSPALNAGAHTVHFENAGNGWIDLDAITILP